MTYDLISQSYSKEHIFIVEIDQDYCSLVSGVLPCEATELGDSKCYNTLVSCNDTDNFDKTLKTYRFCEPRSPHPSGLDAIPSLLSVSVAPATIDLQGGLGTRSNVTLRFSDEPSSDIGIDKYLSERTYVASDRGSFWTKWRARNPHYQNRSIRVLSGYLVNGEYIDANFTTRHYIIDKLDVSNGSCTITGKDPLKLADSLKSKAPAASNGLLLSALTDSDTVINLTPIGIGSDYPSTGFVRVKGEVMEITSKTGDSLTVIRGQHNTPAVSHSANDTVQICLVYNSVQVNNIVEDLLVNYAGIDSSHIPSAEWQAEADVYLSGLLSTVITEPVGVSTLLKELGEQAPHSIYWDERTQKIVFIAVKPPPEAANVYGMDGNLLASKTKTKDMQDLRISTVLVYFGQVDPTQKLDETNNYAQIYARVNPDSITRYGSDQLKTIFSRWVTNLNKSAALLLAERLGRRFGDVPRSIDFALDAKDGALWAGETISINYRDITDYSGNPQDTMFQITSAQESDKYFRYKGIEFGYDTAVPSDEGAGNLDEDLIIIGADQTNINIRSAYDSLFPPPDSSTVCRIIVEAGVSIGSSDQLLPSLSTGVWPSGAEILIENRGFIVGFGGESADEIQSVNISHDGLPGGLAVDINNNNVTIENFGIIGGGGGGGGSGGGNTSFFLRGGGGAGYLRSNGATVVNGGLGQTFEFSNEITFQAGNGGALGEAGLPALVIFSNGDPDNQVSDGGAAGAAIEENGYTVTYATAGDIRGDIN